MADNYLAMSDEDFLKQSGPTPEPETPASGGAPKGEQEAAPVAAEPEAEAPVEEKTTSDPVEPGSEAKPEDTAAEAEPEKKEEEGKTPDPVPPGSAEGTPKPEDKPVQEAPASPAVPAKPSSVEDLTAFHDKIMAPFTANGKKIELKSPEEVVQLMQMGANYTRKMQEMAPHRKQIEMLRNNGIDETKLSFLIDLDKKDPEAIKKLIMESGIDPLDIDTNTESAYREGNHKVSDQQIAFNTQLDELTSSDSGKATFNEILAWDDASKDKLWDNPTVMSIIHQQREAGIYDQITTEMDRRKTLGLIPPTTPFLDAYELVGDALFGSSAPTPVQQGQQPVPKPVVATRTAAPKQEVTNSDKAGAAAATRGSPVKSPVAVNYLSMSDDEFMNTDKFKGRV